MDPLTRDFEIQDYDAAFELWKGDPNIGLSTADDRNNIEKFLKRNPGLSKVAVDGKNIVATVLCGHDGRRGYIYHLYVASDYRRKGLGQSLMETCLDGLRKEKIRKCHLFVFDKNELGKNFWTGTGWNNRNDIAIFSKDL
jgi:N-acetylglutamate synthase